MLAASKEMSSSLVLDPSMFPKRANTNDGTVYEGSARIFSRDLVLLVLTEELYQSLHLNGDSKVSGYEIRNVCKMLDFGAIRATWDSPAAQDAY